MVAYGFFKEVTRAVSVLMAANTTLLTASLTGAASRVAENLMLQELLEWEAKGFARPGLRDHN